MLRGENKFEVFSGELTLAASALQGLVGLLHVRGGESAEGEARVAALVAAEQCMAMCPSLIDPAFYRSACSYMYSPLQSARTC